jgi:hypothetical protein
MRLDDEKLDALRRWGEALRHSDGEENVAAGRAIRMLIEEIDQLQHELSHVREQASRVTALMSADGLTEQGEPALTLHERLQQTLEDSEEAGSAMASDEAPASPQSWLESLRRRR